MQETEGYQRSEGSEKHYAASESGKSAQSADSFTTYVARYYVLTVFSLLAAHQNTTWMTFGTIPNESKAAFGLSDDSITLLAGE